MKNGAIVLACRYFTLMPRHIPVIFLLPIEARDFLGTAQFLHLLLRSFYYNSSIVCNNSEISNPKNDGGPRDLRIRIEPMPPPAWLDSAGRGWNIINPESASVTEPHGQLPG